MNKKLYEKLFMIILVFGKFFGEILNFDVV